jgi:adenylate kinase family enzyme
MRRVSVVGNSGSGKTTLAKRLAALLRVPFLELDSVNHQPNWQPLPTEEFRERVAAAVAADGWVVDGNYSRVRDLVWARADTVVWLDLPRRTVMRQVVLRTIRRGTLRQELWNGNRESLRNLVRWNPEESVVRWSWVKHAHYRTLFTEASADPAFAHLRFVRLRSRADVEALLRGGSGGGVGGRTHLSE